MAERMPDIRILVGNKGDKTLAEGSSGLLIKRNLESALSAGIKIKVGLDPASEKALQTQLSKLASGIAINVGQGTGRTSGKATGTPFTDFKGAAVSTKAMSQATAELTRAKVDSINALTKEKVATLSAVNAKKQEAQAAKTATILLHEEVKQRKLSAEAKSKEAVDQVKQNKALADASLKLSQFNSYLQTVNPKGLKEYAVQIAAIRDGFSSKDPLKIKAAAAGFNELKAAMKTAGYEGGNAFTYLESKIKTFATYLASSAITMGVVTGVRNVISTVKELDGSLTDLRIVTGGTREETQRLLGTYNQMAQELGSTTKAVASSAVEWQRQGYSLADTNTLIKDSMVLSIVGFIDETEAATALTAAMKGYQLSVDEAMSVVDKFTATDMVAASSAGTLAEALAKTAANAKLAGLSLDDVIAQLAVVNETLQEDGSQTGTFYNTMLSRMGNLKAGRLSDPETSEDLSNVEATLGGLGIKLRDSESEFRNFGDVLDEVGGKWDSFSSVQQRAIATAFAGTRQQTRFLSLMSGWSKAQEYAEVAAGSAGTALEKFGVYEESVEAKTNRMTAAFEDLATSILDSGLVGGVIDMGTALLNAGAAFDAWPAKLILISTAVFVVVAAFNALKTSTLGVGIKDAVYNLNALGTVATLSAVNVSTLGAAFSSMTAAQILNTAATKGMTRDKLEEALACSALDAALQKEILAQYADATAKGTNTVAGGAQTAANSTLALSFHAVTAAIWANVKAMAAWLVTNPVGWCILAATAVAGFAAVVSACTTSLAEQREETAKLQGEYDEITSKISGYNSELETTRSRIDELLKKDSLSFVEQEELERLKLQNEFLEAQIKLQKELQTEKANEVNQSLYDEFGMDYRDGVEYRSLYKTQDRWVAKSKKETVASYVDAEEYYQELIRKVQELRATTDYDPEELAEYNRQLSELSHGYLTYAANTKFVDDESRAQAATWRELAEAGANAAKGIFWSADAIKKFDSVWSNVDLNPAVTGLKRMASEGKITADILDRPEYARFMQQCIDMGIVLGDSGVTIEAFVAHLNSFAQGEHDAAIETAGLREEIQKFSDATDSVKNLQNLLVSLSESTSDSLTAEFLSELYELLPDVAGKVNTVQEAQEALTAAIENSKNTAQAAYGAMLVANEDWLSATINSSAKLQSALVGYYKGDVKNWQSSAEAKWKIDSLLVGDLSALWAKYMGMSREKLDATVALLEDLSISYGLSAADDSALRGMKTYLALLDDVSTEFKGVDWTPSSSRSKKTTDLYIAEIDELYESTKRLNDIRNRMDTIEARSSQLDAEDYKQKNEYIKEIIRLRQQENDVLNEQNNIRRQLIQTGVDKLRGQGFIVDYDSANNNLLIRNMERLNSLSGGSVELTNKLRKETEALIDDVEKLNNDAINASLDWHKNTAQNIEDAKKLADNIKAAADAYLQDSDYEFELMKRHGATEAELIAKLNEQKAAVHEFAEEIRRELSFLGIPSDVIESLDVVQDLSNKWFDSDDKIKDIYKEQLDNLEDLVDLTRDMIKQEKEDLIDALESQKSAYADLISLKKKSLELTERERSYSENVNDKTKEISKLQARIDALGLDDSRSAQAERGALLEELAEKQRELADLQRDHSLEAQEEALDQEQKDFERTKDAEIKKIREFLNNNEALTQAALGRINSMSSATFDDLMSYALHYTNTTGAELEDMWDNAVRAARKYGDVTSSLASLTQASGGDWNNPSASNPAVSRLVKSMQENSVAWKSASTAGQKNLEAKNNDIASEIGKLIGQKVVRGPDGEWYIGSVGGKRLYDVYHEGGIVGGAAVATPKQNEVMALLQKKEIVLNEGHQNVFLDLLHRLVPKVDLGSLTSPLPGLGNLLASPSGGKCVSIDNRIYFDGYLPDTQVLDAIKRQQRKAAQIIAGALG